MGPVIAHTRMISTASVKAHGEPTPADVLCANLRKKWWVLSMWPPSRLRPSRGGRKPSSSREGLDERGVLGKRKDELASRGHGEIGEIESRRDGAPTERVALADRDGCLPD